MTSEAPFFVVGCPRSGTTLVRVMLDAHPRLAIPPESHFIPKLAPRRSDDDVPLDRLLAEPAVAQWGLDPDAVRAEAGRIGARTYESRVRALFATYAATQGKARWGDKTPDYVEHLPTLARLFPDARFVHVLRDGREVAASLAAWPWGPASPVAGAWWWRTKVTAGRRAGRTLGRDRYLELRLEDLVADPEGALRVLCRFLDEPFDPVMLDYPSESRARIRDPAETWLAFTHEHLAKPPTAGLRDWRDGLEPRRQRAVEAACRPLLRELGYPVGDTSLADLARSLWWRGVDAVRTARRRGA